MNERIEQIEKETWQNVAELGQVRWSDWRDEFAKLIVQECIDIVGVGGEFASRPKLVEKLQEHFGVEDD